MGFYFSAGICANLRPHNLRMEMKKKIVLICVFMLLACVSACGKKEEKSPEKAAAVTGVKVEAVKTSAQEDFYEAVATVRSKTTSILSSRAMGYIVAVHVREGDRVRPGQLLLEIDNREAAARLKKAQAGLWEAQEMLQEMERTIQAQGSAKTAAEADQSLAASTFNRYQALLERKSVSQQEFDEAQARYRGKTAEVERVKEMLGSMRARKEQVLARMDQAKAEISQTQIQVDYGRILSPSEGVVTLKAAEVGALASPGAPLLTLEDDGRYRLEASVEEGMLVKIRLGESVRVSIDALGDQEWTARVGEIQPFADPASRSSLVKIDLPEDLGKKGTIRVLRSGLYGKARFPLGKREVMAVPQKAVLQGGNLQQVFIVDSSQTARLRLIKTGKAYGDRIEVLSGLRDGERIIMEGTERVIDGNRVEF
jgi:membrane fusion protein, multidrug efflux system